MTRAQKKLDQLKHDRGFVLRPKVQIRRIVRLDKILLLEKREKQARRITARRNTIAVSVPSVPSDDDDDHDDDGHTQNVQSNRPIPQLLSLRDVFKTPARIPFNSRRRKSLPALASPASPRFTLLPKGTTTQIIMNIVNGTPAASQAAASQAAASQPSPGPSGTSTGINFDDPLFGRLNYSDSDSE